MKEFDLFPVLRSLFLYVIERAKLYFVSNPITKKCESMTDLSNQDELLRNKERKKKARRRTRGPYRKSSSQSPDY